MFVIRTLDNLGVFPRGKFNIPLGTLTCYEDLESLVTTPVKQDARRNPVVSS